MQIYKQQDKWKAQPLSFYDILVSSFIVFHHLET